MESTATSASETPAFVPSPSIPSPSDVSPQASGEGSPSASVSASTGPSRAASVPSTAASTSSAAPPKKRAPLVAAAAAARMRAPQIDLTDLSDSDDSPVPVAGPSGPPPAARAPGLTMRRAPTPSRLAANGHATENSNSDDDFTITASTPGKPKVPTPMFSGSRFGPPAQAGPSSNSYPADVGARASIGEGFASPRVNPPVFDGNTIGSFAKAALTSDPQQRVINGQVAAARHAASQANGGSPNGFATTNRWPGGAAGGLPSSTNTAVPSLPQSSSGGDGSSAAPIDVDNMPAKPRNILAASTQPPNPKKPMCIGAFMARAIMLYPNDAAIRGQQPPPGTRWNIVTWKGAEMIHVKLRLRKAGDPPRPDEPWTGVSKDTIQITTYPSGSYIGDLDLYHSEVLIPLIKRGLCRLEGFALRLRADGPMFEVRVNVIVFTLPSNINYIADTLVANNVFLLDPIPPYDPMRHNDRPVYQNAHGSSERAYKMYLASQQQQQRPSYSASGSSYNSQLDKAKQVEVQRQQVDAVFKSIEGGQELEQSDPGPWIKTNLFPHQRKALTFLLKGEQDWGSLKTALKNNEKRLRKAKKAGSEDLSGTATPDEPQSQQDKEKSKDRADLKSDTSRSLWESEQDLKGRPRVWKNKLTGERIRQNKKPKEFKGAILADDMGLGKTLSVVSLIAASHAAAREWSTRELEKVDTPSASEDDRSKLPITTMTTRVFGMPEGSPEPSASSSKGKKRARDETDPSTSLRRSQIIKRSKATLLVCPMSTITNWEDQIKEHWDGNVEVIGGTSPPAKKKINNGSNDDVLRVYIYHGTSRNADPRFLAEFDIVITSYSTLANEYSKHQNVCGGDGESTTFASPADTTGNTDDETSGTNSARGGKTNAADGVNPSDVSEALRRKQKRKRAPQDQQSPLQVIDWFRVVLDEAHSIKSAQTVACKASCYLEADRRIALTGTPIQNKIEDVWALFKFLRISPLDQRESFNQYISTPCKGGDPVGVARLQLIMRTCCLRRTKDMQDNGQKILNLPPRREVQVWLDLREDERKIYDERCDEARDEIMDLKAKKQLTKNYAHVLQKLLRLRQTCDHVDLPNSGIVEEDYDGTIMDYEVALAGIAKMGLSQQRAQSVICTLKDMPDAGAVCCACGHDFGPAFPSIDLGGAEEEFTKPESTDKKSKAARPLLTKCRHIYCAACFKRSVHGAWPRQLNCGRACMVCNEMLQMSKDVIEVCPPSEMADEVPKKVSQRKKWERNPTENVNMSCKMQYLLQELMRLSRRNPYSPNYDPFGNSLEDGDEPVELAEDGVTPLATKTIVFSQWTTMLDRIEDMLSEANIATCRLDGTMTREQRAEQIERLRTRKSIEVMLVSTRAGGVGLNLTAASRCYLIDPYWNPSVEAQAIDRIHRMGQKRPVYAYKLMINNSVEEKLDKLQKKKAELANLSLKNMSRAELLQQKSDELADLFS